MQLRFYFIFFILMFYTFSVVVADPVSVEDFFPNPITEDIQKDPYWKESLIVLKEDNYYQENYYDLKRLEDHVLKEDFAIQEKRVGLYQAKLEVASKAARILPRLTLQYSGDPMVPVNIPVLIAGFFQFLLPENWFNFFRSAHLYRSERYGMADLMLDRYLLIQVTYYEIHRLKWHYTIHMLFYHHLKEFIEYFRDNFDISNQQATYQYLLSFANGLYLDALTLKEQIRQALPELAFMVNVQGVTKETHFDITRIPFPNLDFTNLKPIMPRNYIDKAQSNSLPLIMLTHLKKATKLKVGATATNFVDLSSLGIDLGVDSLINPFIDIAEIKKISIKEAEVKAITERNMVLATNLYNISLERYKYAKQSLVSSKRCCELIIEGLQATGTLSFDIHHSIEFLHNNYLSLIDSYHNMWVADISIKRLLVSPLLMKIENYLPKDRDVELALKKTSLAPFKILTKEQ